MNKLFIATLLITITFILGCKENPNKQGESKDESDTTSIIEKGKEIAFSTFLSLSSELEKAMKSGGVEHALKYCNLNAIGITDSLSKVHDVSIKRTSMKHRNPKNAPSEDEKAVLLHFENRKNSGGVMEPYVVKGSDKNIFYAPIIVQDMCLKCHGPKEEIENYDLIKKHYPEDLAVGYIQGNLRGMWSIEFKKENL